MNRRAKNFIKAGKLYKKKDTGIIVEVVAKSPGGWTTRRINRNRRNGGHIIKEHDLLKHYIAL